MYQQYITSLFSNYLTSPLPMQNSVMIHINIKNFYHSSQSSIFYTNQLFTSKHETKHKMKQYIFSKYTLNLHNHKCCCVWNFSCAWYFPWAPVSQCSLNTSFTAKTDAVKQEMLHFEIYHLLLLSSMSSPFIFCPTTFHTSLFTYVHMYCTYTQLLLSPSKCPLATAGVFPQVQIPLFETHRNISHTCFFIARRSEYDRKFCLTYNKN